MPVDSTHPLYDALISDWELMRDSYVGENKIKSRKTKYLPATAGMIHNGMSSPSSPGSMIYSAYLKRAVYHHYIQEAVSTMLGMLHCRPPTINLPPSMEFLFDRITHVGDNPESLLRRINEEQLITGRVGLLIDIYTDEDYGKPRPYISLYPSESIINWNDSNTWNDNSDLSLVVLRESTYELGTDQFFWEPVTRYRVLRLIDKVYTHEIYEDDNVIHTIEPQIYGVRNNSIPFFIINQKDFAPSPVEPPLMGLAQLALAIYRGEADYRQNLFMQSQDTLVITGRMAGGEALDIQTGAGCVLRLPEGGTAQYIGVQSKGLEEQRQALENDKKQAQFLATRIIESKGSNESGVAVHLRLSSQTASLNQIALTGARGLEKALKSIALWMGENPDEVSVKPNLDFIKTPMSLTEIASLISIKSMGAPISTLSIHNLLLEQGITHYNYEEERDLIVKEEPLSIENKEDF